MTQPTKNFTAVPDSKIDVDSPLTTELMTWLRDNIEHLEEWLGKDYAAAQNHNHDGLNSAPVQTAGGLEARLFAPGVSYTPGLGGSGFGEWTAVHSRGGIWMPHGTVGLHVKGDLVRTGSSSSANYVQYKLRVTGPGGEDESNVLETLHAPGTKTGEVFALTLADANQNAEVLFEVLARPYIADGFPIDSSFDTAPYTYWHHFG